MKIFAVVMSCIAGAIGLIIAVVYGMRGDQMNSLAGFVTGVLFFGMAALCAAIDDTDMKAKAAANCKEIADRLMGRDRPVPVRAVLITASQGGKKNRLVDGAAGQILAGGMGAMVGLMGSGPKSTAVFYVTWSNGKVTTETVVIGSRPFMDYMAVTDQARD